MLLEPSPFPWWLWGLTLAWAGVLIIWQRGWLPGDWQHGMGVVLAVYTMLLAILATSGQPWSTSRVWFWLAGGGTVAASLSLMRAESQSQRRLAVWIAACGLAILLVQLQAELPAVLLLALGGVVAWRMEASPSERPFGIPAGDAWLAVLGTMLLLVAWIGGLRHAVLVESQRPEYSRWVTALPTRTHIERWLPDRFGSQPSFEALAFAGVIAVCLWSLQHSNIAEN